MGKPDERFEKIKEKAREDLAIDELDLERECREHVAILHRYLSLLYEEQKKLKRFVAIRKRLYNELYKHYRWETKRKTSSRTEVETGIYSDPKYLKAKAMCDQQETFVDYLEEIISSLRVRGYMLRNLVDLRKLEEPTI